MVMSNNRGKQIKETGQDPPSTGEYSHYAGMFAWDGRSHTVIGKQVVAMHSAPPSATPPLKKKKIKWRGVGWIGGPAFVPDTVRQRCSLDCDFLAQV